MSYFNFYHFESDCCHHLVAGPADTNCEGYECLPSTKAHYKTPRTARRMRLT